MRNYQTLPKEIFNIAESVYCETMDYDPEVRGYIKVQPIICCEMVYWRKWWGVRNEVMKCLGMGDDPSRISLTTQNLKDIIEILKDFRDPYHWSVDGMSVWDYEEDNIQDQIDIDIYTIEILIKMIDSNDELFENEIMEVYFYDSY